MVGSKQVLAAGLLISAAYLYAFAGYFDLPRTDALGELFTNYAAGFVRRGLLGEIAFQLRRLLGIDPEVFFSIVIGSCYCFTAFTFAMLARASIKDPLLFWVICLSPAMLLFPIYDHGALLRKEAFGIALVAGHARYSRPSRTGDIVLASLLCASTLTHELQIFCLGFHGAMIATKGVWQRLWILTPALLAGALAFLFPGDMEATTAICGAWRDVASAVCPSFLSWSLADGIAASALTLQTVEIHFAAGIALAATPLVLTILWSSNFGRQESAGLFAAILIFIPLFVVGRDWSRWINVLMMHSAFLTFHYGRGITPTPIGVGYGLSQIQAYALAMFYVLGWQLADPTDGLVKGWVYEVASLPPEGMPDILVLAAVALASLPAGLLILSLILPRFGRLRRSPDGQRQGSA